MKKKKVTAADVARECGVSQATVSYVLNERPDKQISEATRQKILAAVKALSYHPDARAQGMRTSRAMSIGVVIGRDSPNLNTNQMLRAIKKVLYENGYSITLLPDDEPDDEAQYISYFLSRRIDGILFLYMTLDDGASELMDGHGIPYLCINETGIRGCGVSNSTGLEKTIRECVLYCREHNFSRISYLSFARKASSNNIARKSTMLKEQFACEYPHAALTEHLLERDYADAALADDIAAIIKNYQPQVIFTPLPKLTLITQGCILRSDFSVPQKTKLISLYDFGFFDNFYPSVTHLVFSLDEVGRYASRCLLDYLAGRETPHREFNCGLRWGDSTKLDA